MSRLSRYQLEVLEAMGIDAWEPRGNDARGEEASPARAADAPGPETPPEAAPPEAGATTVTTPDDVGAMDWAALERAVIDCRRCPLHETRNRAVFGVGDRQARLLVIGEAPGADEDRQGEPFVGRAGQLLDRMLRAIDLGRERVYITNILKSRPPRNRDPNAEEVAACEPYLRRQIELIEPAVILALGRVSAQNLLRTDAPLGRLRGSWHAYGPRETPLRVSYHPAYLLRKPVEKRKAWADLRVIREALALE